MRNKNVELNKAYGEFNQRIGGCVKRNGSVSKYKPLFFIRQNFIDAGLNADYYSSLFLQQGWMNPGGQIHQNPETLKKSLMRVVADDVAYKILGVLMRSS